MKKKRVSLIVVIFLSAIIVYFNFSFLPINALSWDVFGYYLYLPATFIYHDLGLKDVSIIHEIIEKYNNTATFYQAIRLPSGDWVMRYTMGMAVLYSPAFFVGHIVAGMFGFATDGFSEPYQYAVLVESIIITIFGLIFMRKLLLEFFRDRITAAILLVLVLGTNFLYHNGFFAANLMNHNYLFLLYAMLLLFTFRWHKTYQVKYMVLIGVVVGLIVLSRPPELICILIPVLWGIKNKTSLKEKLSILQKYKFQIVLGGVIAFAIGFAQLAYYKIFTGSFLFYTYGADPGVGFDFLAPPTLPFLFGFRKGWLIYTPILIFAIIGFYYLYKRNKPIFYSLFIFFVINLYIVSSWLTHGASFSQKNMIQSFAILAIPLGYLFTYLREQRRFVKFSFISIFVLLILLNLFQTWQILFGVLHPSRMTRAYYFAIFGKTRVPENRKKLLLVERQVTYDEVFQHQEEYNGRILQNLDFEDDGTDYAGKYYSDFVARSGKTSLRMDSTNIFSPGITARYRDITDNDHAWIRASAYIYPVVDPKANPLAMVVTFQHKGANYKYRTVNIENLDLKLNEWNRISLDYMTPFPRSGKDNLSVYMWHRGKQEIYIDNLQVEVFERKE